ncbi:MAG: InlB B-repeat-containing protein [Lachnospiraceae bacterium]|nr:InlB B-repeat-containing protein [Lachnospiraceae bacterium]
MINVKYISADGGEKNHDAIPLSGNETELSPGWYVVSGDVAFHNSVILNGSGEYHIILEDDGKMCISGDVYEWGTWNEYSNSNSPVGLGCLYDDNRKDGISLTIYGQTHGTGELNILNESGSTGANITNRDKAGDAINVDDLTINGGRFYLNAAGSLYSYGINSKDLTINRGSIYASGTIHAINSTGNITFNNGSLIADGGTNEGSCGINCTGNITINGGTITATATKNDGHALGSTGDIIINGGTVIANAGDAQGGCGLNAGGNITISGNVTATATGVNGHAIYSAGNITINGGKIKAKAGYNRDKWSMNTGGYGLKADHITINDGDVAADATDKNRDALYSDKSISINGGKIKAVAHGIDGSGMVADGGVITITDGEVYAGAEGYDNDHPPGDNFGIKASNQMISITGGRVTAKGTNAGIYSTYRSPLFLSWKNTTDYISTNSFKFTSSDVKIETGKTFTDGKGKYYIAANASEIKGLTDVKLSATAQKIHTVSFDCGGFTPVPERKLIKDGDNLTEPAYPNSESSNAGKSFAGWYQDAGYQIRYNFNSPVKSDLYLHAKWANISYSMTDADIKLIYRHTGNTIEPVVRNNLGYTLECGENKNYTYTCKKEGSTTNVSMKEPGFYNLIVTGKGSYSGTREVRVCVLTFREYKDGRLVDATLPEGEDAAVVTASTVTMNSGWYVVTEDVNAPSRMMVKGDVHLVLCDGAELDARGNGGTMGISVTEGNSLTIYSQAGNTGRLVASSNNVNYYAGIGGNSPEDLSSNPDPFPYLEKNKNAGNITIHGGEIIARGSHDSAAIGKAKGGKGGKITIYGGKITAERYAGVNGAGSDTGIGGEGADIHISWCRENDDYILSDGYQGTVSFDKAYRIDGTSKIANPNKTAEFSGKKIVPTTSFETCTVTFDSKGGTPVEAQPVAVNMYADKPVTPIYQGYRFEGWYKNTALTQKFNFDTDAVTDDITLYAKWTRVDYISYKGTNGNVNNFRNYSPMEEDYTELPAGNYFVDKDVILINRISVNGDVNLILGDGKTLTAGEGISVMGRDNTLNIFGQSGGTGVLKAKAGKNNAAIGGDGVEDGFDGSVGNINIYGGIIRPQGGYNAAAIGGGRNNKYYGNICIYGGTVSGESGIYDGAAIGGSYGAAIGGGFANKSDGKNVDGTVEIRGGKVRVKSNTNSTGIGGGQHAYGGTINILGGQVYVTVSSNEYPGIGDGWDYAGEKKAQITLGCKDQTDFIYSELYKGNVRVAPNQTLIIVGTSEKLQGEISDLNKINNKTLKLGHAHKFKYTVNGTTITATCQNTGCDLPGSKATLTLSAPAESDLVYDGTFKPAIVTDEHHISGDEVVHYQKKNGSSWAAIDTAPKDAGIYRASITLTDSGTGSRATVQVDYEIKKRDVTITGLAANNKIYDDTTTASVNDTARNLDNKIAGDAVDIKSGNAKFDSADAGENKTVTFTGYSLAGADAGNYNLSSQPAQMTANITKRPITIRANDQVVEVKKPIELMAATCDKGTDSGIVNGHALTALTLTPDPDPLKANDPGNGTIRPSGAVIKKESTDVTQNYDITYVDGNLEIIKPRAEVTTLPIAITNLKYNGLYVWQALISPGVAETKMEYKVVQFSRGTQGLLKNEDGSYVRDNPPPTDGYGNDLNAYRAWEAGSYNVWFRAAADETHAPSLPECVSVDIATVPLNIRVKDTTIEYGEKFLSGNAYADGLVNEHDWGRLGALIYYYQINGVWKSANELHITQTCQDVGVYPTKAVFDGGEQVYELTTYFCYDITSVPGFQTIVPRTVSLNWEDTSFTFDGKPQVPKVTLSNLSENAAPDVVDVIVTGAQVNANDPGQKYTATVVALSGKEADKYVLPSDNTIAFTIAKNPEAGNIPNASLNVPYTATSFTASVAGKMPRDAGKLTYTTGTISSVGLQINNNDYEAVVNENGLLTVTKKSGNEPKPGEKLHVNVNVDSTNYTDKSITVESTFVNKTATGVYFERGDSLSVNIGEDESFTLTDLHDGVGANPSWTWESSNTNVAEVLNGLGNSTKVTIKGVGTTAITAKLDSNDKTGYATLILTVNPVSVPIPAARTGLVYNGFDQTGVVSENAHYILSGGNATNPGDYTAIATLTEPGKYRWSDGSIDIKYIPWSIDKQPAPAAPVGLKGISPTTDRNNDGKIEGTQLGMEYSSDADFSGAILCTGDTVSGLTPGTWYVRVRETEFVKAGVTASVEIIGVTPPVVKPRQGLIYNGSPQVLVDVDTISAGEIYFATTIMGDPQHTEDQYTTDVPEKTNHDHYVVWYQIRGAGESKPSWLYVDINEKDLRNVFHYISMSPNGLYGYEGMIDIRDRVPEDEPNPRLRVISADTWGCITDHPTIDNPKTGATTMRIHYFAARDEDLPETLPGVNRYVSFTVSVDEMKNYHAYNMTVKTTFFTECSTNHADTEMVVGYRAPNCTEKGYTGDIWCHDCHAILRGEDIPVVPDAHDFDFSHGDVTKQPTTLTWGKHTYHCIHDPAHTITREDIPNLPSEDGRDYSDFVEDTRFLSGDAAISLNRTVDPETEEITETVSVGGEEI